MIKILDLFSGIQSVKEALELMKEQGLIDDYDYYGIDIYSPEGENIILDLSQDDIINKVIATLPPDWKPDFIWASPVCSKFSVATAVKGGNLYFERTKEGIKPREDISHLRYQYRRYTKELIKKEANLHLKLVSNMQLIIDYFDCDFVIENPRSSFMIHILNPLYVPNKVDYCMYGFTYKKPTTIYSNYNLELKSCNHKKHKDTMSGKKYTITRYAQRASVPPELIKDILNIFLGGTNENTKID